MNRKNLNEDNQQTVPNVGSRILNTSSYSGVLGVLRNSEFVNGTGAYLAEKSCELLPPGQRLPDVHALLRGMKSIPPFWAPSTIPLF